MKSDIRLNISNIQHFSVGDGDGIRTTVFFKGCNMRCPWCHNPENLSASPVTLSYSADKVETRGYFATVEDILPELLEDKDFYETSGGGVTLSGGEVMLQASGAAALADALMAEGVSVLIDTAGCVPYAEFEKLRGKVSGYLYDFKTADRDKCAAIGGDFDIIADNLRKLITSGESVRVRIPLIPGFNTDEEEILGICSYLSEIGADTVDLLPFHRLGSSKYEAMGMEYSYRKTEPMSREEVQRIADTFAKHIPTVSVSK